MVILKEVIRDEEDRDNATSEEGQDDSHHTKESLIERFIYTLERVSVLEQERVRATNRHSRRDFSEGDVEEPEEEREEQLDILVAIGGDIIEGGVKRGQLVSEGRLSPSEVGKDD